MLLALGVGLAAEVIPEPDSGAALAWSHECNDAGSRCVFEKMVEFNSSDGAERGGIIVVYDKPSRQPEFIVVVVPSGLPSGSEVVIGFLDSLQKDGKWTLVPVKDSLVGLPLSDCDKSSCQARVHSRIPDGPDLFEEFQRHRFASVLYKRGGKSETFLVPLAGLITELASVK